MFWNNFARSADPFRELQRLQQDMNRLFHDAPNRTEQEFPAVNVWTGREEYVVTTEIPGIDPAELDITVLGDTVTLRGSRTAPALATGETFHRRERGYGQFVRSLKLPKAVDPAKVEARYARGILSLTLPRAEEEKPRKITLKSA